MAAIMEREQLLIKPTGNTVIVPDSPVAKLMYYFHCVCSCVADSDDPSIKRLRAFQTNYNSLSSEEVSTLLVLCLALSPDKLINSVFFLNKDINQFFEVSAVSTKLLVSESLLIGGQRKRVQKIMMFKKEWLERNYIQPLKSFVPSTSCCTIL